MTGCAKDDISVAGQLLDNLLGLQVPNVNKVVLRPRDDPLPTGDREVGKDAVLFVFVTRVGLEALALRVVPQLECVVERGCQDVLAIGTKLDK